jgi:hypothetical protein
MFGDIVKVTPTSKVVGDMAILMVTSGMSRQQVLDPDTEVAFPESVVQLFRGDLGQPAGGFPPQLQKKILKGQPPLHQRPGASLPPLDFAKECEKVQAKLPRPATDYDLASYLMYPRVWTECMVDRLQYGDVGILSTPVFFYGMEPGQEVSVDIERGRTLIVRYVATSDPQEDGTRTVFFELNGQPRSVQVADRSQIARCPVQPKAQAGNLKHIGAPMPGSIATLAAVAGRKMARRDATDDGGEEDGDRVARRGRRRDCGSVCKSRAAGERERPARLDEITSSATPPLHVGAQLRRGDRARQCCQSRHRAGMDSARGLPLAFRRIGPAQCESLAAHRRGYPFP